jgi:hypothetical protein
MAKTWIPRSSQPTAIFVPALGVTMNSQHLIETKNITNKLL